MAETKWYSELSESLQGNCLSATAIPGSTVFVTFCPTQDETKSVQPGKKVEKVPQWEVPREDHKDGTSWEPQFCG